MRETPTATRIGRQPVVPGVVPERDENDVTHPVRIISSRQTQPGIVPGQGPYLYSYSMNDALARNTNRGTDRTKMNIWRAPSLEEIAKLEALNH